jgi:hypothetical protein
LKQTEITRILETCRGKTEFQKGYKPRLYLVIHENSNLLEDSQNIMNMWKNYFHQLLNVNGIKDVRQTEIHTAEPLVPEPSFFEVEIAAEKL